MSDEQIPVTVKAQRVRDYVAKHPHAKNKTVAEALSSEGVTVRPGYVAKVRRMARGKRSRPDTKTGIGGSSDVGRPSSTGATFPRDSLGKALRIPRAILDQNAGRACTVEAAADFAGVKRSGPFQVEVASATKFGLLDRLEGGRIKPSELAKRILRPQAQNEERDALRQAVLLAPVVSSLYKHYRNENLPDDKFLRNTAVDTYGVPEDKFAEFKQVFLDTLQKAGLLDKHGEKVRVIDVSGGIVGEAGKEEQTSGPVKSVTASPADVCFVVQPYKPPLGDYYEKIYKPAIEKAGLRPMRADADIFGTGKIMDQIWSGINGAKVLVAELTTRNPNVFYELGLAHALHKPVVLVSSNEDDVPFDLQPIRVIYYDVYDPSWGTKLLDKVAENILSAIRNPEEAVFKTGEDKA